LRVAACVLGVWLAGTSRLAHADLVPSIDVTVTDLAAGHAYLEPGESAGIHAGDTVTIGKRGYPVIASNARSAVIELGDKPLALGAHGSAAVSPAAQEQRKQLPTPRALTTFREQWPHVTLPASEQSPQPVPLGPPASDERARAQLSLRGSGNVPLRGKQDPIAATELRARAHYEPVHDLPLRLDADVATQLWLASNLGQRAGDPSRPLLRVRELQAAYGADNATFAALGRMRYASRTLGMLDGARAQATLGRGFALGAFGGFVPDPFDGTPAMDSSRFGAELSYRDLESRLRPEVSLTAQGSRYAGALDERRLTSFVDLYPGAHRIGGYAEVSFYDDKNPWHASAQELSAAGVDGSLRVGKLELGGRFDLQRPERSRWLASYLPPEWLCTQRAALPSATPEPCHDNDARYLGSGHASWTGGRLALSVGATASATQNASTTQAGSFARITVLNVIARARVEGSFTGSTGSLLDTVGGSVGVGSPFAHDKLDVSLHYRPAWLRYTADPSAFVQHAVGASMLWLPSAVFDLSLNADLLAGRDVSALLVQTLMTVRPGR
jgi:hypothetical protein